MKGYLRGNKGMNVSERKLKKIMPTLAPSSHSSRQSSSLERRNPAIYSAHYFGHKIHMDQNEKLVQYGVTYVMARDGYSGKIVGAAMMPQKNNEIIYANVYRAAINEYGLWNQLRVDHGKEFTSHSMFRKDYVMAVEILSFLLMFKLHLHVIT